jgi:hypothetical protein
VRFCTIHFHIIVGRHVALYYKGKHPKGVFLAEVLPDAKYQIVHALDVAHCRVAPNIGPANPAKTLLNLRSVKEIVWVSTIKVEGNLTKIPAWELFPLVCIGLHKFLVVVLAVILFVGFQTRAF